MASLMKALPGRLGVPTLQRTGLFPGSPKSGESKTKQVLAKWKELDENLSSFERLDEMRKLVSEGSMSHGAYDMLHDLAVSRATGKTRKANVTGVTALEHPIMAGYLFYRVGKTWRKRYVLLFTERLEYHGSKQESETNRGLSSSLLVLTEKFFVSDSSSRRLKNSKDNGFMVSDFTTTHYFAADSKDLAEYWMHTIARTIKKLQEAKSFFDNRARIVGKPPARSLQEIEMEYQARLLSYEASKKLISSASASAALPENNTQSNARQSIRLKQEATELESKRIEHAVLQKQFADEAASLEEKVESLRKELEHSGTFDAQLETEIKQLEKQRVDLEELAGLEAKVAAEYEELAEQTENEAAAAEAREEVEMEFKRKSMAVLSINLKDKTPAEIQDMIESHLEANDDDESLKQIRAEALESVAKRVEMESKVKAKQAEIAIQMAEAKLLEAQQAKARISSAQSSDEIDQAMKKVHAGQEAELEASRLYYESQNTSKRAEALSLSLAVHQHSQPPIISPIKEEPVLQAKIETVVAMVEQGGSRRSEGAVGVEVFEIRFGELCSRYDEYQTTQLDMDEDKDPSFDIVGLLVRAKKQALIDYVGGNLFRGSDDGVVIWTVPLRSE